MARLKMLEMRPPRLPRLEKNPPTRLKMGEMRAPNMANMARIKRHPPSFGSQHITPKMNKPKVHPMTLPMLSKNPPPELVTESGS